MKKPKILVIGDSCLDQSAYCTCSRLEPSCGVPVLDVITTHENPGMAGNLAENIRVLGGDVDFITNDNWREITKTRLYEEKTNHFYLRYDKIQPIKPISNLKKIDFKKYKAVVVSDYNKNFLNEESLEFIGNSHNLTFIDTKRKLGAWTKSYTFIKINRGEYKASEKEIKEFDLEDHIIETMGEEGIRFRSLNFPVEKVAIRNLVGAGDVVLAALVVKYIETENISKSIKYANEKATLVVQKRGIGLYSKQ